MNKFLVYGLVDPRTDEVRYIGKSQCGLARPKQHTKAHDLKRSGNAHKAHWVRQLLALGLKPTIRVLEDFPTVANLADAECFWIAQGRGLGWPLTNVTKGGDGARGHKVSEEVRAAHRARTTALWADPEYRARTTASHIGATHTAESRETRSARMRAKSSELRTNMRRLWDDPTYRAMMVAAHTKIKKP